MNDKTRVTKHKKLNLWREWELLTYYERFEHSVILVLTALIALTVLFAVWNLLVKVVGAIIMFGPSFDPTDHGVFQSVFGMIFTVIIALEFKRSLLVTVERKFSIVQVRAVILIAMLAIVRKFILLDLAMVKAEKLFALSAAILALGIVYWLAGDRADKEQEERKITLAER